MIRTARPEDVPQILRFVQDLALYEKAPHEARATGRTLARRPR